MNEYITRAEPSWKNPKSAHQWRASLETHARAIIDLPVDQIDVNHLIKVFEPIWYTLPETARRVRGRIEAILSLSKTKGNRTGENPAAWRDNLKNIFKSTPTLVHGHFASMYYQEVPNFLRDLRLRDSMSAVALEWIILTVSRAQVAVSATWSEINIERRLWRIKSARMKGDKEAAITGEDHVVPLTARAIAILEVMSKLRLTNRGDELIFPSTYGKPLSLTALDHCRERMNVFTTTHGFRSTFRTWVGEQTFHEEALAEKALAHVIGDEVKRAYNRGELLEKRRVLMNDWSDYLDGIITQEKNPFVRQGGVLPTIVMDALKTRRS
jgi:integrase